MVDSFDQLNAQFGGVINEDVIQRIVDLSHNVTAPFTQASSEEQSGHPRKEWTIDELAAPDLTNKRIDGQDTDTLDDTAIGQRAGNYHTISTKTVRTSTRSDNVDRIGAAVELSYQIMQRTREVRRDNEAQYLDMNASTAGVKDTTPSESAGVYSWLTTNTDRGATGADGGHNFTTGIVDAPTNGTPRALTETVIRDIAQGVYESGGEVDVLMSGPPVIRGLSEYMFTDSARIANLMSDVRERTSAATATGSVNLFVTDFGVNLRMIPNRLHPVQTAASSYNVGLFDMALVSRSFLHGYRTEPLAKSGLSEKVQVAVDVTLVVRNEAGLGVIADVDATLPVTQS